MGSGECYHFHYLDLFQSILALRRFELYLFPFLLQVAKSKSTAGFFLLLGERSEPPINQVYGNRDIDTYH